MRATYRSGDCWGLRPVKVCIKLSVSNHQTFAHLYIPNLLSIQRISIPSLVSVDTTHDKKVSSSQTTCLTDLPSWLRSQASYCGRRNVYPSIYVFAVCYQVRSYLFVLTAAVDSGQEKKKKVASEEYSNEDVFMCISKVDCQRHIHTAARVYTYIVNNYIALIVCANEPYQHRTQRESF